MIPLMFRILLRVLSIAIGALALFLVLVGQMGRPDTYEELEGVLRGDAQIGALSAAAVFLYSLSSATRRTPRWWLLNLLAVALIWIVVTGGLRWRHRYGYYIRSGLDSEVPRLPGFPWN
jgi:hypothetical protein